MEELESLVLMALDIHAEEGSSPPMPDGDASVAAPEPVVDRAIIFVDASNYYHAMSENGIETSRISFATISRKLVGPARHWVGTRYYTVSLDSSHPRYEETRRFQSHLAGQDARITLIRGTIRPRPPEPNPLSAVLRDFVVANRGMLATTLERRLLGMAKTYDNIPRWQEKGVDVKLAVDMFRLARDDMYDTAYLLSADADFVPAVEAVMDLGKKVFPSSPRKSKALGAVCGTFIYTEPSWFDDCYVDPD